MPINETKKEEREVNGKTIIHKTKELGEGVSIELFTNGRNVSGYRVFDVDVENECDEKATYECVLFPSLEQAKMKYEAA